MAAAMLFKQILLVWNYNVMFISGALRHGAVGAH